MARMKILDLIALVKRLMPLLPLLTLPNWLDSEAVRQWAIKVLAVLDDWAKLTATEVDDTLVDFGQSVTADAETWDTLYTLFHDLVTDETGSPEGDDRVTALANKVGIDPVTIIMIIKAVMELISWWRNRDTDAPAAVANQD